MTRSNQSDGQRRGRRAFSLVELLVVVAVAVVLLSIFIPYVSMKRESDRRARCSDNLRALGNALRAYADGNDHAYPRVRFDMLRPGYVAFTGADSADPFGPDSLVQPNDVTASIWLVVRLGLADPSRFVCPSSRDVPDPSVDGSPSRRSNFSGSRNLSYSYCSPFSTALNFQLNTDKLKGDFAVMADRNPGGGVAVPTYASPPLELARANSKNHNRAGQNVLYADGHVQFQQTPYCGYGDNWLRDNIFTAFARVAVPPGPDPPPQANGYCDPHIGPAWEKDSYLVPTAGE